MVVVADWLVKAEHDTEARPILVSTSKELIDKVGDRERAGCHRAALTPSHHHPSSIGVVVWRSRCGEVEGGSWLRPLYLSRVRRSSLTGVVWRHVWAQVNVEVAEQLSVLPTAETAREAVKKGFTVLVSVCGMYEHHALSARRRAWRKGEVVECCLGNDCPRFVVRGLLGTSTIVGGD